MTQHSRSKPTYAYAAATAAFAGLMLSGCTRGPDSEVALNVGGTNAVVVDHYKEGRQHFFAGQYGLAVNEFHTSLLLEGGQADTYNALGATYDKLGRFDLAQRYYKRALAINPNSPEYLNNYGYSLFLQGKTQQAARFFSRARRQDANNPVIQANLRRALEAGKPAQKYLASAAEPYQPEAAEPPVGKVRLERTARNVYTVISKPRPEMEAKATVPDVDSRPAQAPVPAAGAAAKVETAAAKGDAAPAPILASWRLAVPQSTMPQPKMSPAKKSKSEPAIRLANVEKKSTPTRPESARPGIQGYSFVIANGTGRRHMAGRMRGFLLQKGLHWAGLRNADNYSYRRSVISAKQGYEQAAQKLKARLPGDVRMVTAPPAQTVDIQLILGADLLGFDARLIKEATRG